jgi:hypothetical protein
MSVETRTGQEHLETSPVLARDQLNILSGSISEAEGRLQVDGGAQVGKLAEQEPSIDSCAGCGYVVTVTPLFGR